MAEHALVLAPDLAEAHVALGIFYYYGYRQYDQALAEFQRAIQLQPNNAAGASSTPATFIAGKGSGRVVWKSLARLSK